jgi:ankyrin repeat protein
MEATDQRGRTAIMTAASKGHTEVVRFLRDHGRANLRHKDLDDRSVYFLSTDPAHVESLN